MNFKKILDIIKNPPPPPPKNPPDAIRDFFVWIFTLSFLGMMFSLVTVTHFSVSKHSFSISVLLSILVLLSMWGLFVWRWKGDIPLYIKNKRTRKVTEIKQGKTFISVFIIIFLTLISYIGIIVPLNSELILMASRQEIKDGKKFELYLEKNKKYFIETEMRNPDNYASLKVIFKKDTWEESFYISSSKNHFNDSGIEFPIDFPGEGLYQVSFEMSDDEKNIKAVRFFIKK